MHIICWMGQESERKNWALGASLSSLAPIGKHDVHTSVFRWWPTPLLLCYFLFPLTGPLPVCLQSLLQPSSVWGTPTDSSSHGERVLCFPRTYGVSLFYSQLHKNILLSHHSRAWVSFRTPEHTHSTQSLQYAPSGFLGLYLGNKAVIIPFACFFHCLKWYSSIAISFCCVNLVAILFMSS